MSLQIASVTSCAPYLFALNSKIRQGESYVAAFYIQFIAWSW